MECAICLGNLQEGTQTLPCNHSFHCECISQWKKKSSTCPMCRSNIPIFCGFCNNVVSTDSHDFVKLSKCECTHHFSCWRKAVQQKKTNTIQCPCGRRDAFWQVQGKDYGDLLACHETYIGYRHMCRHPGCFEKGNPRRNGMCQTHQTNVLIGNYAIKSAMEFMVRFGLRIRTFNREKLLIEIGMRMQSDINLDDSCELNLKYMKDLYKELTSENSPVAQN